MVTKHVPADINPIWNTSFSIRGVSEVDVLEFVCTDYGVFNETHTFGLGPKRVARGVCKIADGSFAGWIDSTPVASTTAGSPLLHISVRLAEVQGELPPLGVIESLTMIHDQLAASGSSGSSRFPSGDVVPTAARADQALATPTAPLMLGAFGSGLAESANEETDEEQPKSGAGPMPTSSAGPEVEWSGSPPSVRSDEVSPSGSSGATVAGTHDRPTPPSPAPALPPSPPPPPALDRRSRSRSRGGWRPIKECQATACRYGLVSAMSYDACRLLHARGLGVLALWPA